MKGGKTGGNGDFMRIGSGEQGLVQFKMRIQCGIKLCWEHCSKLNGVSFTHEKDSVDKWEGVLFDIISFHERNRETA